MRLVSLSPSKSPPPPSSSTPPPTTLRLPTGSVTVRRWFPLSPPNPNLSEAGDQRAKLANFLEAEHTRDGSLEKNGYSLSHPLTTQLTNSNCVFLFIRSFHLCFIINARSVRELFYLCLSNLSVALVADLRSKSSPSPGDLHLARVATSCAFISAGGLRTSASSSSTTALAPTTNTNTNTNNKAAKKKNHSHPPPTLPPPQPDLTVPEKTIRKFHGSPARWLEVVAAVALVSELVVNKFPNDIDSNPNPNSSNLLPPPVPLNNLTHIKRHALAMAANAAGTSMTCKLKSSKKFSSPAADRKFVSPIGEEIWREFYSSDGPHQQQISAFTLPLLLPRSFSFSLPLSLSLTSPTYAAWGESLLINNDSGATTTTYINLPPCLLLPPSILTLLNDVFLPLEQKIVQVCRGWKEGVRRGRVHAHKMRISQTHIENDASADDDDDSMDGGGGGEA